jgi:hypothetical protein
MVGGDAQCACEYLPRLLDRVSIGDEDRGRGRGGKYPGKTRPLVVGGSLHRGRGLVRRSTGIYTGSVGLSSSHILRRGRGGGCRPANQ